jgi:uncharacterized membrane protein
MSSYFSDIESEQFVHTIAQTETQTIGEVRIHIEDLCEVSPYDRAIEVFNKLGMYNTAQKTGVLIYLATEDKKLAIVGDKGIHDILGIHYWDKIIQEMKSKFQSESIFNGVMHGLKAISSELITHFPEKRLPNNELSNDISYGKI